MPVTTSRLALGGHAAVRQVGAGTGVGRSPTASARGVLVAGGGAVGATVAGGSAVGAGEGTTTVGVNGKGLGGSPGAHALSVAHINLLGHWVTVA